MDEAQRYFRWHMHIWPRRATLHSDRAGAEVGYETNVVPTFPETTAEKLGKWYREGPNPEYVARTSDGRACVPLAEELSRVLSHR